MIVAFRVDSSTDIGSGHVMRCLALAAAVRGRGAQVSFLCRDLVGNLAALIVSRGFPVVLLPDDDAASTRAGLPAGVDWLVVDHYGLGSAWESAVRPSVGRILVMDDLADRPHDCDLLVDPTFPGDAARYASLVPPEAVLLLGPRFAQLAAEFAQLAAAPRVQSAVQRLFVFYGGSDLPNLTSRTLRAVSDGTLGGVTVDVVLGSTNPHGVEVASIASQRTQTHVHGPQLGLAPLMSECTIAATAGGVTLWEVLCLGLPGVVVSLADNQVPSCRGLQDAGLVTYLGTSEEVTEQDIAHALTRLLADLDEVVERAALGQAYVDGRGPDRVAEVMVPTSRDELVLRNARASDRGRLFTWANDPDVRRSARSTAAISWPEHRAWFEARLSAPDCSMYVLEASGVPVGQARFDVEDGTARLDYSLDSLVRGRAWGAALVTRACDALLHERTVDVIADVRSENTASLATLASAGFVVATKDVADDGLVRLRLQRG